MPSRGSLTWCSRVTATISWMRPARRRARATSAMSASSLGCRRARSGSGPAGAGPVAGLRREAPGSPPGLLAHLEGLDHIVDLDVVVADADTALEAIADLGGVFLEPLQRLHGQVVGHHHAVAQQPCLAVAGDRAGP